MQWQKGSGDQDFDDNASIDLHFTTDNPATVNFENFPDSLLQDVNTRTLVKGLSEDGDARDDMYVWNFGIRPETCPLRGRRSGFTPSCQMVRGTPENRSAEL